jgi:hypothetical protein
MTGTIHQTSRHCKVESVFRPKAEMGQTLQFRQAGVGDRQTVEREDGQLGEAGQMGQAGVGDRNTAEREGGQIRESGQMGQSGVRDSFLGEEGEIHCLDRHHASKRRQSLVADVAESPALQIPEPGKIRQRGQARIADDWPAQLRHRLTGVPSRVRLPLQTF